MIHTIINTFQIYNIHMLTSFLLWSNSVQNYVTDWKGGLSLHLSKFTHAVVFLNCVCIVQASPKSVTFYCFTVNEKLNRTRYSNDEVTRTCLLPYVLTSMSTEHGQCTGLRGLGTTALWGKSQFFLLSFLQLISCFKC